MVTLDSIINNYLENDKVFAWVFKLTYILYALMVVSIIFENINFVENTAILMLVYPINMFSIILFCISIYKSHIFYTGNLNLTSNKSILEIVKLAIPIFMLCIIACTIINEVLLNVSYSVFIISFAFTDIVLLIKNISIKNKLKNGNFKFKTGLNKIPVGKLFLIETILFIIFLGVICGLSLGIEPIYKALEAYDSGISTDLSVPIRFWIISGGVSIAIMIVVGILIVKLHNKNRLKNNKETIN